MQLIKNGPDIPERLLQAHEDGKVVFFCGAGISYPAKLPGFSGLVNDLYDHLGELPSPVQKAAIKAGQFDTAIGLLEMEIMGGREKVRKALFNILQPDLSTSQATKTHEALLTLSKTRDHKTRLITTNFDRIFESIIARDKNPIDTYRAPLLPIPKNKWDGLVYLHGVLPDTPIFGHLERLVLSSGDFGLAYLTERWASRFVSELFRNYTVCFVGYSINDPILRYMMDALAADKSLGETPPEMFAFGSYQSQQEITRANEWIAKNVTPILYKEHRKHHYLHRTLHAWAEIYRDGIRGKEKIIADYAITRPIKSTKQDDFIGRLLWAISDPNGLPAKQFAKFNPAPSLDWLEVFSEKRFGQESLNRFGIQSPTLKDQKLDFSLIYRPSPHTLSAWMSLAHPSSNDSGWDPVMIYIAKWLVRHLGDPRLILWISNNGISLDGKFAQLIESELTNIKNFEAKGDVNSLNIIRENSPNAIPNSFTRILWDLLLSGRVIRGRNLDLYRWFRLFEANGLTTSLRGELKKILSPKILINKGWRYGDINENSTDIEKVSEILSWEVVLTADHTHLTLKEFSKNEMWLKSLSKLQEDFTLLLAETMDLKFELGEANELSDRSYFDQPSISPHAQNRQFHDWTALIELNRDAWLDIAATNQELALSIAQNWWNKPYPIFKRLALFAGTHTPTIPPQQSLIWLLSNEQWWLWSIETQREAIRLIVAISPHLEKMELIKLQSMIMKGPPKSMFNKNIDLERWLLIKNHSIWLRLAKIASTNTSLEPDCLKTLSKLTLEFPDWVLSEENKEEFPHWMDSGWVGEGVREPWLPFAPIPKTRRGLLNHLIAHPNREQDIQDDWDERCKASPQSTSFALYALSKSGMWPIQRWDQALQSWTQTGAYTDSWRYTSKILNNAPNEFLQSIINNLCWWLEGVGKNLDCDEDLFINLCQRLLAIDKSEFISDTDVVTRAINHPVGKITEALLRYWYGKSPNDGENLPLDLKNIFTEICVSSDSKFNAGRVILSAQVVSLFRVDRAWTSKCLLPLFDWQQSQDQAKNAWEGYLWSPRLYPPLLREIKIPFLETSDHYEVLGKKGEQYASLLTYIALDPKDSFTQKELTNATRTLPSSGLVSASRALVQNLESAGEQKSEFWKNRIEPYFHKIWPKSLNKKLVNMEAISENFCRLCIAADAEFPAAFNLLDSWLMPSKYPENLIQDLLRANICVKFPESSLKFLNCIIGDNILWIKSSLQACLNAIETTNPNLSNDSKFQRLAILVRKLDV